MDFDDDLRGKRHFAIWQKRDRVALLGYSRRNNDVLAVRLDTLPEDERNELINIATNADLQRRLELASTLNTIKHTKSGETWFTNIAMRLRRGDGSVIRVYVKDLYEVEPDQLAFYKGYGPKAPQPAHLQISEAEKAAVLGDDYRQRTLQGTTSASVTPQVEQETVSQPAPAPASAPASEMNALAAVLGQMTQVLQRIDENTRPKKPGRPSNAEKAEKAAKAGKDA